ncbi:DoxX family protein [Psychroflexus sp. ALD_RP9]|uniref:DoxX family protein n=1 Tax=Psychroflexus sp. ALD_RP9 TaxID=2777186 RepID=UPI001A90BE0E|nr:DoxX family protein [Psychroflexus sp. ALD_RP9]QSS97225.1 DoxX family protein [Psychroflexus sp. ALD_RP9]
MDYIDIILKLIIALGIFNVWLIRYNKPTKWRGAEAKNMADEFKAYGLPSIAVPFIGGLKVLAAIGLILSFWFPEIELYSALVMSILMIGAISMHVKINDELKKSLPAFLMLLLSILVILIN